MYDSVKKNSASLMRNVVAQHNFRCHFAFIFSPQTSFANLQPHKQFNIREVLVDNLSSQSGRLVSAWVTWEASALQMAVTNRSHAMARPRLKSLCDLRKEVGGGWLLLAWHSCW